MRAMFFNALIRRFIRHDTFEADIDLVFGVYARRTIRINNEFVHGGALINPKMSAEALTEKYRGKIVSVRVDRPGQRADSPLALPVFVSCNSDAYPFTPTLTQ